MPATLPPPSGAPMGKPWAFEAGMDKVQVAVRSGLGTPFGQ